MTVIISFSSAVWDPVCVSVCMSVLCVCVCVCVCLCVYVCVCVYECSVCVCVCMSVLCVCVFCVCVCVRVCVGGGVTAWIFSIINPPVSSSCTVSMVTGDLSCVFLAETVCVRVWGGGGGLLGS